MKFILVTGLLLGCTFACSKTVDIADGKSKSTQEKFLNKSTKHSETVKETELSCDNLGKRELPAPLEAYCQDITPPPASVNLPVFRAYDSKLKISEDKLRKVFIDDIDGRLIVKTENKSNDKSFFVQYKNGTSFNASYAPNSNQLRYLLFSIPPNIDDNFFYETIKKKILIIGGAQHPEEFYRGLVNSKKITKYHGCIVQQKRAKYGLVELTSCQRDNMTLLTLYNPE